jgi:dTDP-4-dehydrorhamnose reductase
MVTLSRANVVAKVAIVGAAGQLGQELVRRLPPEMVLGWSRCDCDLTRTDTLRSALAAARPGLVINCAAYNLVDQAEAEPAAAFAVNAFGVKALAEACRDLDIVLVHFSTDYVFGLEGFRPEPYTESAPPGPISIYGLSKLAGEYLVRALCPRHFVIRTCGLYGRHGIGGKGTNFVETMLRLAREGKPLRVVDDQVLTPTSAADLADATLRLLDTGVFGLYHLTNQGQTTWFEFAQTIFELAGVSADLTPITTAEYPRPARRPAYSVLGTEHLHVPRLRPWREALAAYLADRARASAP